MATINYPEVPKYKKSHFPSVEALIEIFEKPLNEIGLTENNCVGVIDDLRKHYEPIDKYFFYHILWTIEEMRLFGKINFKTKDIFSKERSLDMKPHVSKMFDNYIKDLKNQVKQ